MKCTGKFLSSFLACAVSKVPRRCPWRRTPSGPPPRTSRRSCCVGSPSLDARGDSALRVSCGLERLSRGSGWCCYPYPSTPPVPRPAWRASATNTNSVTDRRSAVRQAANSQDNCVCQFLPPVSDSSVGRHRPGAHSVGQGLNVTAAPTSET